MRQFEHLNGVRGLAAVAVVFYHAKKNLNFEVAQGGYLAVDLFFILSGFVLSAAYDERLKRGLTVGAFTRMRLIRFYPLYALGLAMGAMVRLLDLLHPPGTLSWGELAAAVLSGLLFLPSIPPPSSLTLYPLNAPAWSLLCELLVNIAFAGALVRMSQRHLLMIVVASYAALLVVVRNEPSLSLGAQWPGFGAGLIRSIFGFGAGVLLHRARWHERITTPRYVGTGLLALLTAVLCMRVPADARLAYDLLAIILVFPAIVVIGAATPASRADRAYRWLGLLSYPLYAIHIPILMQASTMGRVLGYPRAVGACAIVVCLGAALVAYFADEWLRGRAFLRKPG